MRLYLSPELESELRRAISEDNVDRFGRLVAPLKWGKPSWSAKQLLLEMMGNDDRRLWHWTEHLASHRDPSVRRCATTLLVKLWGSNKAKARRILTTLAEDENWVVREDAHGAWGELLTAYFEEISPILENWSKSPSANLRRCVVIAVRKAGNLRKNEWAEPLLKLIKPLLTDKTVYVRKNLGPYAIGDGMLRCYPSLTLKYLRQWANSKDEGTLWNVAMSLASYGGNKNWHESMRILTKLAADDRRYVWRAVASALIYLARRHPEIQDTLKQWRDDDKSKKVAAIALKYLTK